MSHTSLLSQKCSNLETGNSRYVCAKHHSAILMTLPVVYDEVRCPSCSQPLRVWPPDRSPTFSCAGCSGHHGARANSGCNLFRCFGCGYDLCLDCVKGWRREQALFLERQRLITDAERRSPPSAPASAPQNPTSNRGRSVTPPPSYQSALAMQPPIEDESGSKQGPLNV